MTGARAHWLSCGRRLHLHHGPIDMIVSIQGPGARLGFTCAVARFDTLLEELVSELRRLRSTNGTDLQSETAHRMQTATTPFAPAFITPMAAVAGAGADTILRAILTETGITKAYVNNGGDIAFHLTPGETMTTAIATNPPARVQVGCKDPVRGIATSGRGGRSHSLGIADSVTVLASCAAQADAAATMIANAVDLPGHPAVARRPATDLAADSDLGDRLITTGLGPLTSAETDTALAYGQALADSLRGRRLIHAACLTLEGCTVTTGPVSLLPEKEPHNA